MSGCASREQPLPRAKPDRQFLPASLNISWRRVRKRASGRAIFRLIDRSIVGYASAGKRKIAVHEGLANTDSATNLSLLVGNSGMSKRA